MTAPIVLDLDSIELLASNATPGPWWIDSHGHMMVSQANGGHQPIFQAANLVEKAARHPETGNLSHWPNDWDASFIASANPSVVLELVRRLRAADALATSRIEQIPIDSKVVAVFHDVRPEQLAEAEEFAEAIKKRCTSGQWTLVAFFPIGTDIQALDKDQMLQAGWVRQPKIADRKASVDADALRQVLQALAGPAHHIRELQVCRGLPGSPIEKLIAEFNAQIGG